MDLDAAYANMANIPDGASYPERWAQAAAAYRDRLRTGGLWREGLSYGDSARQAMDLALPDASPKGLVVFVHGGYWLRFDRSFFSHLAEGARACGWAVALPSYDLCPDVRIADITQQMARAVTRAAEEVAGDIRLAGHSAGGHLVARMTAPSLLPPEVMGRVGRVLPISPVSDLRPLMRTSMNADFRLDEAAAIAESPALCSAPEVPVTVWVGGDELPAFLDQARWLAEAWGCDHVEDAGMHHFNVIEALEHPASPMVDRLLG